MRTAGQFGLALVMVAGATAVAWWVFTGIARDIGELVGGAGWWALVAVAWPVFLFVASRRS